MKSLHAIAIHNCNAVRTCIIQQCPPGLLGAGREKELTAGIDSVVQTRLNSVAKVQLNPAARAHPLSLNRKGGREGNFLKKFSNLFKSNKYQIGLFLQRKNVHSSSVRCVNTYIGRPFDAVPLMCRCGSSGAALSRLGAMSLHRSREARPASGYVRC